MDGQLYVSSAKLVLFMPSIILCLLLNCGILPVKDIVGSNFFNSHSLIFPSSSGCTTLQPNIYASLFQVSDEEVEAILPTAEYALAKVHMHLVYSGYVHKISVACFSLISW